MDYSDEQLRKLRLAVHDALAGLDELVMTLKVARRTPEALSAESLTQQTLGRLSRPPVDPPAEPRP